MAGSIRSLIYLKSTLPCYDHNHRVHLSNIKTCQNPPQRSTKHLAGQTIHHNPGLPVLHLGRIAPCFCIKTAVPLPKHFMGLVDMPTLTPFQPPQCMVYMECLGYSTQFPKPKPIPKLPKNIETIPPRPIDLLLPVGPGHSQEVSRQLAQASRRIDLQDLPASVIGGDQGRPGVRGPPLGGGTQQDGNSVTVAGI